MLLSEAESDVKILKLASNIVSKVFDDNMIQSIKYALEANPSYVRKFREPIKPIITEITKPVHIIYEVYFCSEKDKPNMRGWTAYHEVPTIRLFVADLAGRAHYALTSEENSILYNIGQKEDEFDEAKFRKCWFNIFVHETSHALDKLFRHSDLYSRHTKSTLRQTQVGKYADDKLEANARVPQVIYGYCEELFELKKERNYDLKTCVRQLDFKHVLYKFEKLTTFDLSDLSDDMRKRTIKRLYDAYTRIKEIIYQYNNSIKSPEDLYSHFDDIKDYHKIDNVYTILGKKAKITTIENEIYYVEMIPEMSDDAFSEYDFLYKVKTARGDVDDGSVIKFKHKTHQDAKTLIFDVEFADGEKLKNAVLKCKKIEKL